jgi:4'-phosphopantetheinyl transferase EntD
VIKEFEHPEHCWKWTPTEVEYLNRLFSAKDAEIATLRAAAKQALEALQKSWNPMLRSAEREGAATSAIAALQSALKGTP